MSFKNIDRISKAIQSEVLFLSSAICTIILVFPSTLSFISDALTGTAHYMSWNWFLVTPLF